MMLIPKPIAELQRKPRDVYVSIGRRLAAFPGEQATDLGAIMRIVCVACNAVGMNIDPRAIAIMMAKGEGVTAYCNMCKQPMRLRKAMLVTT